MDEHLFARMHVTNGTYFATDVDVFPLRFVLDVLIAVGSGRMNEFSRSLLDAECVRTLVRITMMCSYVMLRTFRRVEFEFNGDLVLIQPIH